MDFEADTTGRDDDRSTAPLTQPADVAETMVAQMLRPETAQDMSAEGSEWFAQAIPCVASAFRWMLKLDGQAQ